MTKEVIKDNKDQDNGEDSNSKMAQLLSQHQDIQLPQTSEAITGKIISVSNKEIHVDVNGITTGVIRGYELEDESGEYAGLKVGNEVTAIVIEEENENGEIELSFREASHKKAWDNLSELMTEGKIVEAEITDANRGGLMIKVGKTAGFLPVSQLIPEHYPRVEGGDRNKILEILNSYIGTKMKAKVIDINEPEEKLIVSEKAAWEEEQKETLSKYKVGEVVEGQVTGVVKFGAFIKFDEGLEGLIHISELAWQRIDDPRDFIKVGQTVKAQIIEVDGSKISLSMKKITEDPWVKATKRYKIGQKVHGEVVKVNPFGIFVKLDDQIQGLAHISELSDKPIKKAEDVIKIGKSYDFKIISIEPKEHRLGLSIKALTAKEPAKDEKEKPDTGDEKTEKPAETDDKTPAKVEAKTPAKSVKKEAKKEVKAEKKEIEKESKDESPEADKPKKPKKTEAKK